MGYVRRQGFLNANSMLADKLLRMFGMELNHWKKASSEVDQAERFHFQDREISIIQGWPFSSRDHERRQMDAHRCGADIHGCGASRGATNCVPLEPHFIAYWVLL